MASSTPWWHGYAPSTMTVRAAIYARISDDRSGAGLGVQRQEQDCRTLADRLGWEVGEVYVDNDLSAYDRRKKRPAWLRLLADLEAGTVTAVLAWHPDRMYRQSRELLDLIDLCDRGRVQVQTVTAGEVDLSTPAGRAVAKTIAAWNEYESEQKGERQRAKYRQLAEAGEMGNGGQRPFGYTRRRTALVPTEAAVLLQAYRSVAAGASLRSVVLDLNQGGHTTTTGRPWTVQALRHNLLSGRNAGLREHRGVIVGPAVWPAVVDRETWETVKAILTDPARKAGRPEPGRKYLLTGLLFCGLCGHRLRPSKMAEAQRVSCPPAQEGGCSGILIKYGPVEEFVTDAVLSRVEYLDAQPADHSAETLALQTAIERDEARLDALAAAYADDEDVDPLEMRAAGARLRSRLAENRRALAGLQQAPRASLKGARDAWPGWDLDRRRALVVEVLERIDVAPAVRGRKWADMGRLTLVWR